MTSTAQPQSQPQNQPPAGPQTVSQAVATRDNSPAALIERYSTDFTSVLPSHIKAETWVRLAQGVLRRDQKLKEAAEANPSSMLAVLMDAARQGLEPGTEQYYLVPYKNKGRPEVQGIRGYQGEIELIYRAGAVSSVIVETVHAGDTFTYRPGREERPLHEVDWMADDRGELKLVYAYAVMKDGATSKVVVLNKTDIARAKASSQSAGSDFSPWKQHEKAMWMKTAAHQLQKWVPTSAEYIRERVRAVADANRGSGTGASSGAVMDGRHDDAVDAEVVDEPTGGAA